MTTWFPAKRAFKKVEDILHNSATVYSNNFKFGSQLRFGEKVPIATIVHNLMGAG